MAHPYSTIVELQQSFGGAARLTQATDWDQDTNPDLTAISNAIEEADSLIDSYLNKQRYVPFDVVPTTVKWISARLARFRLASPRGMIIQEWRDEYDSDLKWLKAVADGEITLGVDPQPQASSMRIDAASSRSTLKDVSRFKLKGFS